MMNNRYAIGGGIGSAGNFGKGGGMPSGMPGGSSKGSQTPQPQMPPQQPPPPPASQPATQAMPPQFQMPMMPPQTQMPPTAQPGVSQGMGTPPGLPPWMQQGQQPGNGKGSNFLGGLEGMLKNYMPWGQGQQGQSMQGGQNYWSQFMQHPQQQGAMASGGIAGAPMAKFGPDGTHDPVPHMIHPLFQRAPRPQMAHVKGFADGGTESMSSAMPYWVRQQNNELERAMSQGVSTPIKSEVPGRTDQIPATVPAGAYVLPADVVSGVGEGNTNAGSAMIDRMLNSAPFGIKEHAPRGHRGPPPPPRPFRDPADQMAAKGGGIQNHARIIVAGGEHLIHPNDVRRLGHGDLKRGHDILDSFVKKVRAATIAKLKKLPGPKK